MENGVSVPSNVWANNEAETYPSGPTEPVEEMDEATIAAKVEGASDGKENLCGSGAKYFF